MKLKFDRPKDFGTIVTEKAPSRADYLLNDAITSIQVHNAITSGIWHDERISKEQREEWIREEESMLPQVGDEFVLPEDYRAFHRMILQNGDSVKFLYLQEKNTGRIVRLFCSTVLVSVGNLAQMIKKDSSYDERFFGKTISIDNEFYEKVSVFDEYECIREIRNHRVYEINIKD